MTILVDAWKYLPLKHKSHTFHSFWREMKQGRCQQKRHEIPDHTLCPSPSLQWRHNGRDGIRNHEPRHCLLNRLFRHRSKKTSKLRYTGLYEGNSPVTSEFPAQRASNADNISIWWRHHALFEYIFILEYVLGMKHTCRASLCFCCGLIVADFNHIFQGYFTGTGTIVEGFGWTITGIH